jgi:hypothetical protein
MVTLICTCLPSSRHIIEGSATIIRNAEEGRTAISPDLRQFSSMIPISSPRSEVTGVVVHILFDKKEVWCCIMAEGTHPWKIPLCLISVGWPAMWSSSDHGCDSFKGCLEATLSQAPARVQPKDDPTWSELCPKSRCDARDKIAGHEIKALSGG